MMSDGYLLPSRKARICRIAGALFLVLAAFSMSGIAVQAFVPELSAGCARIGCTWNSTPLTLLDEDDRAPVTATPAARQRFDAYTARPIVRLGMAGAVAIAIVPFALLMFGVGIALRRIGGRGGDPFAQALPWLRRASLAAIISALATPVSDSLMAMLLYRGTPMGPHWLIRLNFDTIGTALMLGIAAYATVWALEAGLRAQRELAEIV